MLEYGFACFTGSSFVVDAGLQVSLRCTCSLSYYAAPQLRSNSKDPLPYFEPCALIYLLVFYGKGAKDDLSKADKKIIAESIKRTKEILRELNKMDKKLFEELRQSLLDMEAHAAGKKVKGVREVVKEVRALKPLSKEDIVKLRKKLRVSQSAFAVLLNISTKTVQKWEQGENQPNGSSLKLLAIAKKNPKMLYVN